MDFKSWFLFLVALGAGVGGRATAAPADPFQASNSDEVRRSAINAIPLDRLDPAGQQQVRGVLSGLTIFRRMPVRIVECQPSMFQFLVRHPDVVVNVWQVLGCTQIQLLETAPGKYQLADNVGTKGSLSVLFQDDTTVIGYGEGCYQGPLVIRPIRGRCVLVLKFGSVRENDGKTYITTRLDTFLNLDPGAAELLTKAFEPLVGKIADLNYVQTVAFVGSLSRTAEANPRGVQRLSTKLQNVAPEVREEFARVAAEIGRMETLGASGEALPHPSAPSRLAQQPADQPVR